MNQFLWAIVTLLVASRKSIASENSSHTSNYSTVLAVLLVRNEQHTLPSFLTLFERMDYPKSRIGLFIRSDHNSDDTIHILETWLDANEHQYHSDDVILEYFSPEFYENEDDPFEFNEDRYANIVKLKSQALEKAKEEGFNYIWFIDIDVLLMNPSVIQDLIEKDKVIVAPMLQSKYYFSNFWAGMTEDYEYKEASEYFTILSNEKEGCFSMPIVHSCILVDLRKSISERLTFKEEEIPGYSGPNDEIFVFAASAKEVGAEMHICNDIGEGFFPIPFQEIENPEEDMQRFKAIQLKMILRGYPPIAITHVLKDFAAEKETMGFQKIYYVNLDRRPDRRMRMIYNFEKVDIEAIRFSAIDGKMLNSSYLKANGIKQLEGFKEFYEDRDMKLGEVGCFLSHYYIWKDIVENDYEEVLIIEDDAVFEPNFKDYLIYAKERMAEIDLYWDLIYLGRKKMTNKKEKEVDGIPELVEASFSLWTVGYALSVSGAKKLLEQNPLNKIMPVDEYFPVMYNKHPKKEYRLHFPKRKLKAYAFEPAILNPSHYTGDEDYITDTEDSSFINVADLSYNSLEQPLEHEQRNLTPPEIESSPEPNQSTLADPSGDAHKQEL